MAFSLEPLLVLQSQLNPVTYETKITQNSADSFIDIGRLNNNDTDFVEYIDSILNKALATKSISLLEKVSSLYAPDSLQAGLLNKLKKGINF